MLVPAVASSLPLNIRWYSFGDQACTNPTDPVSVIFYGSATSDRTSNHIGFHTNWGNTILDGSDQYFVTGGYCNALDGQRADDNAFESRHHIRWKASNVVDPDIGQVTIGTPHYEDIQFCKHAVRETVDGWSGYDRGRRKIYELMNSGHYNYTKYVGNSAKMTQCDGGVAWSNGQARYVQINAVSH